MRPKEVCRRLGISYPTLSRWVREGRIRAIRTAGGVFRIPESEVRRIAEGLPISKGGQGSHICPRKLSRSKERLGEAGRVLDAVLLL